MRRKLISSLVMVMISTVLMAQYVPNNAEGFQFISLFNPAFSGVENFDDFKLSYRYQWTGYGKAAPKFINLSYQKRIKQPLDLNYNAMRLSNHSTAAGTQQLPKSKRIIHGLGGNIFQSSYGVVKSIGANVSYSLNYPISEKARLAFGISTLVENRKLDVTQVSVRDPDEFYNYLLRSSTSQTDLNVRAGVLFYGENFYAGLSYLPVINFAIQSSELAMDKPFYRGSFQFGYSFPVSSEITLKPSVLGLVQMNNHLVVDYNVKAFIQNKVWLGLSYRDIKSGVVILGFNLNEKFTFSYAYEMSMGQFQKFNDGSHELVLAARLNNLKRYSQYIW